MPWVRQAPRIVVPAGTDTVDAVDRQRDRRRRLDDGRRGRPAGPGRRREQDVGQGLGAGGLAGVGRLRVRRRIAIHAQAVGHSATIPGCRNADSIADDAVWPSPQIDASRIAWPISRSSASSSSRGRTREPAASRASSSSWRTLPTRHGTHWPHDSSRKNWAIRRSVSTRSDRLVEDHDHARAERRAGGAGRLEGERHVERVGPDEDARRAAEQDRPDGPAARHAAGQLDQVAQRRPELDLVDARPRHVAGQAEELRSGRAVGADPGERLAALEHDERHVGQRLDVVDDGRLAEQADLDRERRLVARLAALALDRFEERRLLAADVGAGAAPELDVEGEARAEDVAAEEAGGARRLDRRGRRAPRPRGTRRGCRGSPCEAPVANAAMVIASTVANGSPSSRTRSLNVPGSDSSALQTR